MEDRQSLDQQVEVAYRRLRELLERSGAAPEAQAGLVAGLEELEARTQAALATERTFASTVLDTVGALVVVLDREGRIVRFNRMCEQATGYAFEEAQGRIIWDFLLTPEEVTPVRATFDDLRAGHFPNEFENTWVARDGSRVLIAWTNTTIPGPDGSPEYIIGTGLDITARQQAESQREAMLEELRETRDYLDNLLTYANAPIIVWDPRFKITRFNGAFERLTGLKADDVLGRDLDILFPEERKEEAMTYIRRAVAGERLETVEIPIRRADGTVRTVLWNSATLYAVDGTTPVATIAQGQDVTDRVQVESQREAALQERERLLIELHAANQELQVKNEELQSQAEELEVQAEELRSQTEELHLQTFMLEEERARLRAIIDSAPEAMLVADERGEVVLANPAAERLFAGSAQGAGGPADRRSSLRYRPDHTPYEPHELPLFRAAMHRETPHDTPMAVHWPDGEWRDVLASAMPILDSHGQCHGAVAVYRDITERLKAERELRVALEKYRVLFESFPLGITISDATGQVVESNKEGERLLGVPPAEQTRRHIAGMEWQIIRPDGSPMPAEEYASVRALREKRLIENVEMGLVKEGGDITWINVNAAPIPLEGYGVAVAYGDITSRKRAESQREAALTALRDSERRFSSLVTSMTEGVALHSLIYGAQGQPVDYVILDVNPAYETITGLPRDRALGCKASELYGTGQPPYLETYAQVVASGEPASFDTYFPPMNRHFSVSIFSPAPGQFATVFSDVTERVQAEAQREAMLEELRETRDYLDNLLTYANAPIIVWDPRFKITRFNGAFERLTGLRADDVLGRDLDILFPKERKEEAMTYIHRAVAGERLETVEIPIRCVDGTVRTVLWNSATLYAADGTMPVATIAQGQDITERVQAESERERLLEQAQRDRESIASLARILQQEWDALQTIMESTPAQLAYLDRDFTFIRVNIAYTHGSGHREEELIGRGHFDLFPNAENQAIFEQVRATGQPAAFRAKPFEFADQPERGVTYWDWTLVPVKEKEGDGQVRGLVLSLLDVTDQVLSRQAVEELAARDEAILNSLSEGVITLGPTGKILAINPAALRILGFESVEHAGRRFRETPNSFEARDLNGAVVPIEASPQARLMRGEIFSGYELQVRDLVSGATWIGSFSGAPVRDAAGSLAMGVLAVHDITVEKQAQAQRDATLEELKAALAEKEVLMREIYHRVKNNVQALIYLMDMQADYIPDEATREMIRELQERARAMALVHEKLYQSQNLAQIDFGDYLYDLVDNLSHAYGADRPIVWRIDVEDVALSVDTAIPCGLIVSELLTNALKYAFPGGQPHAERGENECIVSVASRVEGDQITLAVSDNGVGLPAGVDWATTKTLGLQLINILACHQLGGQVEVDRSAGTTFTITFTDRERKKA